MSRVVLSFAAVLAIALGMQVAPADAGKIGNIVAKTATKAAVKAAVKGGNKDRGDKDDTDDATPVRSSLHGQTVSGDVEARSAHAKAKLDDETNLNGASIMAASTAEHAPNVGIVCLAGCN